MHVNYILHDEYLCSSYLYMKRITTNVLFKKKIAIIFIHLDEKEGEQTHVDTRGLLVFAVAMFFKNNFCFISN